VGVWWILAASAGMRGSYEDERMMRRLFAMLGLLVAALLATVFISDQRQVAIINLAMITTGFYVATNYLRDLDRGR
jgi:positive regulator of sigma E activity